MRNSLVAVGDVHKFHCGVCQEYLTAACDISGCYTSTVEQMLAAQKLEQDEG